MKKPLDASMFEEITRHIKIPFMEMICGTLKKEERIKSITRVILDIDNEEHAKLVAELIVDLQQNYKIMKKEIIQKSTIL